jgi:hypothetical protein
MRGDRICWKRLRALIPVLIEAMERRGYLQLDRTSAAWPNRGFAPPEMMEVAASSADRGPSQRKRGGARYDRQGRSRDGRQVMDILIRHESHRMTARLVAERRQRRGNE